VKGAERRESVKYDRVKRAIDVVAAALLLVALSPLMLIIGGVVRAALGRPVLFRQARVGRASRIFRIVKFRSMRVLGPGEVEDVRSDAARLGKFGRALRATSLDELPELWNVLRGDMSLVGPRPLLPEYLPLYTAEQARRHEVRPGITGLAQVRGRNLLDWPSRFELDVQYVDHRSFSLDIRILLLTIGQVVRGTGVSQPGTASAHRFNGER
jgi:lipopolysaccharide/colanic/teichoic acid biosynthesis glycosyltransferase